MFRKIIFRKNKKSIKEFKNPPRKSPYKEIYENVKREFPDYFNQGIWYVYIELKGDGSEYDVHFHLS